MTPKTPENKIEELRPYIEKMVAKVDSDPEYRSFVTGFVFLASKDGEPKGLIKLGNIDNTGNKLVQTHAGLALMAADKMQDATKYPNLIFADIGEGTGQNNVENLADELARQVLTFAGEPEYTSQLIELAQRYISKRT